MLQNLATLRLWDPSGKDTAPLRATPTHRVIPIGTGSGCSQFGIQRIVNQHGGTWSWTFTHTHKHANKHCTLQPPGQLQTAHNLFCSVPPVAHALRGTVLNTN